MRYAARRHLAGRSTRLSFTRGRCFATHVTRDDHVMQFLVLGPLEVRVGPEVLQLGGGKQRAVLAALSAARGRGRLRGSARRRAVGRDPARVGRRTRSRCTSRRLRQLLNGHGPVLHRRGTGYMLELGSATLDASYVRRRLQEDVSAALRRGRPRASTVTRATAALAIWRGSALADVARRSAWAARKRSGSRSFACVRSSCASTRSSRSVSHEQAVGELQPLVAQNPYRERFVAQLMLGLCTARVGRPRLLEVYEQTRRRLDDDLGLRAERGPPAAVGADRPPGAGRCGLRGCRRSPHTRRRPAQPVRRTSAATRPDWLLPARLSQP